MGFFITAGAVLTSSCCRISIHNYFYFTIKISISEPALAISRWAVVFCPVLSLTALLKSQPARSSCIKWTRVRGVDRGQGSSS